MQISVIIPIYNEQENLVKRLSFLCKQANKFPIEIVVSNSPETTDKSSDICQSFDKVRYLQSEKKGRAAQMNFGAKKAKGDIFLFLHADVQLPDDFYSQIKRAILNGNKFGFFAYQFDRSSFLLNVNSRFTKKDGLFTGGGDQCHFFTKDFFENLKGYNENFCIMEDFEMIDRIKKSKIPLAIIQSKAIVSARKYNNNSWLKVNLINGYVFFKYKLGTHPQKLRKIYRSLLREKT